MSDALITSLLALVTALFVWSSIRAAYVTLKPGFSERTQRRAYNVLTAMAVLAGVVELVAVDTLLGTLTLLLAVLILILTRLFLLVRRTRAREAEESKK